MCLALYLVAPHELAVSARNEARPAMYVAAPRSADDRSLVDAFDGEFVYYLGSHEGCGCGWNVTEYDDYEKRSRSLADRDSLIELLSRDEMRTARLACCWEGDQAEPMEERIITLDQLSGLNFRFEERCIYRIVG